jgi:predicted dehydrogenase
MLNIRISKDAWIVAYADPDETSRKLGRHGAGPEAREYTDYRDLLADTEVDAVVISTPNYTHVDVLADAFQTTKHILIEKPLCTTLEDCFKVEEAAAEHPGVVWVGMEYRYIPAVSRLIEEAHSGRLGQLRMLPISEHREPFLKKTGDWNRFNRNTGGTLVEKCVHFFDLMNLITRDRPIRVYASGGQAVNHLDERYDGEVPDILDHAYTIVEYAGGCRAMLDLCMFAEGTRNHNHTAVVGDRGKVECFIPESKVVISERDAESAETTLRIPVEERILNAGWHAGSTYFEHQAFLKAVREGSEVEVTVRDGLRAVALGIAAHRSIEEGRPVEMSELGL